jgi:hypothetical protein
LADVDTLFAGFSAAAESNLSLIVKECDFLQVVIKVPIVFLSIEILSTQLSAPRVVILVGVAREQSSNFLTFPEIIMKLKSAVVALALSSVFGFAFAGPVPIVTPIKSVPMTSFINDQFQTVFTADIGASHSGTGIFTDTFDFGSFANQSLASASLSATLVGFAVKSGYSLISGSLGSANLTFGTQGTKITTLYSFDDLMFSGPLLLTITGKTINGGGSFGGTVNVVNGAVPIPSPVPEPETYAMMLAGLGLLGFAARRKAKANQG